MSDNKEETGKSLPASNNMQHKTKEERYSWSRLTIAARIIEMFIPFILAWIWTRIPKSVFNELLWLEGASRLLNSTSSNGTRHEISRQVFQVPYLWSDSLPQWNVIVSMLTSVIVVLRASFHAADTFGLVLIDLTFNVILLPLWIMSVLALLLNANNSYPDHPNQVPWYLVSDCATAHLGAQGACRTAQFTFGITCGMVALYGIWIIKIVVLEVREFVKRRRHQAVELP